MCSAAANSSTFTLVRLAFPRRWRSIGLSKKPARAGRGICCLASHFLHAEPPAALTSRSSPLSYHDYPATPSPDNCKRVSTSRAPFIGGHRILIADDNPNIRTIRAALPLFPGRLREDRLGSGGDARWTALNCSGRVPGRAERSS